MSNTFGILFRLTTFGESHGSGIGGVIDGCPAGIIIDEDEIRKHLDRRKPSSDASSTKRAESDKFEILSGLQNGKTTGAPIGFFIPNEGQHAEDYREMAACFRPNHADYSYFAKYSGHNDVRGGGRSSARETVARVIGGAVARQVLSKLIPELRIRAFTRSIGHVSVNTDKLDLSKDSTNYLSCPDDQAAKLMDSLIQNVRKQGDTLGGIVECVIEGCPAGIGEPLYDKLSSRLASAMLSINAVKGFEIGAGFEAARMLGSQVVDNWVTASDDPRGIRTATNFSGGIQGGISNGENIIFRVAFKPIPTLMQEIKTVDRDGKSVTLSPRGRHDVCAVPRAVPIVESMAAMTLLDLILIQRAQQL